MGIQSTTFVSRAYAIERIRTIVDLARTTNYRDLELFTFERENRGEDSEKLKNFVVTCKAEADKTDSDYNNLDNLTDKMLGDIMSMPFFRRSMFDNYIVSDDGDA